MKLRVAAEQELDEVREFYGQIIDAMEDSPYPPGWERGVYPSDEFLRTSLKNGELYLAEDEGRAVGVMVMNHEWTDGYEKIVWQEDLDRSEVLMIHALGVRTDCQGQGVAVFLVQEAIRIAGEQGARAIRLDVLQNNLPAQKLYLGQGFVYRGSLQLYYEDTGLTDFLMYEYGM